MPMTAKQLYLHSLAVDQSTAALRLAECIERVEEWMKSNRLKLNSDKSQFLWLGSSQQLAKIHTKTLTIGDHSMESSTSVFWRGEVGVGCVKFF